MSAPVPHRPYLPVRRRGLNLIELLVAIAIIAIVFGLLSYAGAALYRAVRALGH